MAPIGAKVHMRLNRVIKSMLTQLDQTDEKYREPDSTVVVRLDKALYGCVEASLLWCNDLKSTLTTYDFIEKPNTNTSSTGSAKVGSRSHGCFTCASHGCPHDDVRESS